MKRTEIKIGGQQYNLVNFRLQDMNVGDCHTLIADIVDLDENKQGCMEFRFSNTVLAKWQSNSREYNQLDLTLLLSKLVSAISHSIGYPMFQIDLARENYIVKVLDAPDVSTPDLQISPDAKSYLIHSRGTIKDLVKRIVHGNQYANESIRREILRYVYIDTMLNLNQITQTRDMITDLFIPEQKFNENIMSLVSVGYLEPLNALSSITPVAVQLTPKGLAEHDGSLKQVGVEMTNIKNQINNYVTGNNTQIHNTIIEQTGPMLEELSRLIDKQLSGAEKQEALTNLEDAREQIKEDKREEAVTSVSKLAGTANLGMQGVNLAASVIQILSAAGIA